MFVPPFGFWPWGEWRGGPFITREMCQSLLLPLRTRICFGNLSGVDCGMLVGILYPLFVYKWPRLRILVLSIQRVIWILVGLPWDKEFLLSNAVNKNIYKAAWLSHEIMLFRRERENVKEDGAWEPGDFATNEFTEIISTKVFDFSFVILCDLW